MKSPVIKRSIVLAGHKTSVSLEDPFWQAVKEIAEEKSLTLSDFVGQIDTDRRGSNLSSAIRVYVVEHYKNRKFGTTDTHAGKAEANSQGATASAG